MLHLSPKDRFNCFAFFHPRENLKSEGFIKLGIKTEQSFVVHKQTNNKKVVSVPVVSWTNCYLHRKIPKTMKKHFTTFCGTFLWNSLGLNLILLRSGGRIEKPVGN